jgi:transcriptional regulator with XRE-family HTH domain
MDMGNTSLEPKLLGFWTRCIRETAHWSQEALAASSNLDVRTIQRIEAGKPASITTRRSLARGLGYDNQDIFEDPKFIKTVHELLDGVQKADRDDFEKQFPDHVPVKTTVVTSGEALGQIAECSEAYLFHSDNEISAEAKQVAATIFDYLRDLGDIISDISCSDKLQYIQELEAMLRQLQGLGAATYSASRSTKMVGAFWDNKTPVPLVIGYLTVVPEGKVIEQMMVPRRLS